MTPEGKVKVKVKALLKEKGAWFFIPAMGTFGRSGVPDFIGCYKGSMFAVETKAGEGKCTELQKQQIARIKAAEGFAVVVNETEGWDILEAFLNG